MTSQTRPTTARTLPTTVRPATTPLAAAAAKGAVAWSLLFGVFHFYWALGGSLGLGDGAQVEAGLSGGMLAYDLVVAVLCFVGAWVAYALGRAPQLPLPRWMFLTMAWTAALALVARGGIGVVDDILRSTDVLAGGLSGMPVEDVYGEPHPSSYTMWSMRVVDGFFVLGGLLFATALRGYLRKTATS
ncbi:DUF3995 domain-containing protein [Streptomyces sp. NBC_01304]|uniref:DUF3995 domain-containing protein n=1 Tax=Streptomyces sp. NBC_01304 TaxID=2903818 RepID=UPI002E10DC9E|nr:DUF3995 domain-containing protein [Streptomyces sp. NBC_01304]